MSGLVASSSLNMANLSSSAATGFSNIVQRIAEGTELQMPGTDCPYIRLSRGSNMVQMRQRYQGKKSSELDCIV